MAIDSSLSNLTGLPTDQIRLVLGSLLSIILCHYLPRIPASNQRRLYSTILGTLIQTYVYCDEPIKLLIVFGIHVVIYLAIKQVKREQCGKLITIGAMSFLSLYHIYRMVTDYGSWRIDVATVFMVFVCKYSSFAFAYQDGIMPDQTLSAEQRLNKIVELPSFYEYFSYIQFLPTAALGPTLEYREYERYILQQSQYAHIPGTNQRLFQTFGEAVMWISIYMLIYPYFHMDYMRTSEFLRLPWWKNILYTFVSLTLLRSKYYFAWKLGSCSVDACGLSYSGKVKAQNGQMVDDWSLIPNINPWVFEMSPQYRDKIKSWNMSVQGWLQKCIYHRFRTPEQYRKSNADKSKGQLLVFLVSAFWHGFYPGYYISFFFWYNLSIIIDLVSKFAQHKPQIMEVYKQFGIVGKVAVWAISSIGLTYLGCPFQLLNLGDCLRFLQSTYFIPNILVFVGALVIQQIPMPSTKKIEKATQ